MTVYTSVGPATAHVSVFSSFTLEADKTTAYIGDTVTFTPRIDSATVPAARWRWAASDTSKHDTIACANNVSPCKKAMVTSGTMWAYLNATPGQGDSAGRFVTVLPKTITVSCDPMIVTRTLSATCTATGHGAGSTAIKG
jgi:hypothetical protein